MFISESDYKDILSRYPSGVTVITTSHDGENYGFTASSFTGVSLDPPLVLFCLSKNSFSYEKFKLSECFLVNFLSKEQSEISNIFSKKLENKFKNIEFEYSKNLLLPQIRNSLGYVECRLKNIFDAGDHSIFLGEVLSGYIDKIRDPLYYFDRKYQI